MMQDAGYKMPAEHEVPAIHDPIEYHGSRIQKSVS